MKLTDLAREAIFGDPTIPDTEELRADGASFVTLRKNGRLRGCIGTLQAYQPLGQDIVDHARMAAFEDHRFPPVTAEEMDEITVEVSVLSSPVRLGPMSYEETLATVTPGQGVILESQLGRATFLPQVWEELPEPADFFDHLMYKAGWRQWPADAQVSVYTVTEYRDDEH